MPSSAGRTRLPGAEHDRAALQVLAGEAAVLPRPVDGARRDGHAVRRLRVARSCITTVSAPCGITRAGEDAHRFAGAERRRRTACPRTTRRSRRSVVSRVGIEIGEAHRPAVHRRVVVARHVERRFDVGGQHAIERRADVHALDRGHRRAGTGGSARAPRRPAASPDRSRRRTTARAAFGRFPWRAHSASGEALPLAASSAGGVDVAKGVGLVVERALRRSRSVAYHASILRPPPRGIRARCGSTSRRTSANTGCGWSNVRATARSIGCASNAARKPRDEIGRQERRIARARRDERRRRGGHARRAVPRADRRSRRSRRRRPDSRTPHSVRRSVGVDDERRRPAARAARSRARPAARPSSSTNPLSTLPMRRPWPPASTTPVMSRARDRHGAFAGRVTAVALHGTAAPPVNSR